MSTNNISLEKVYRQSKAGNGNQRNLVVHLKIVIYLGFAWE